MQKEKKDLENFKQEYNVLQQKYNLPEFGFLNENFDIELVAEIDTDLVLKRIRKQITEKISSALRALEMFIHPQEAPLFIFSMIKSFNSTDKEIITALYNKFAEFEIFAFGLENEYSEKKEAEFIKKVCGEWKEICGDFNRIYESMKIGFKKDFKRDDKSYLG